MIEASDAVLARHAEEKLSESDAFLAEFVRQFGPLATLLQDLVKERDNLKKLLKRARRSFEKIEETPSYDEIDRIVMRIVGDIDAALE